MIFVFLVFSANNNEHILPKCRIIVGLHFLKLYISKRALKKKKRTAWQEKRKNVAFSWGKSGRTQKIRYKQKVRQLRQIIIIQRIPKAIQYVISLHQTGKGSWSQGNYTIEHKYLPEWKEHDELRVESMISSRTREMPIPTFISCLYIVLHAFWGLFHTSDLRKDCPT